MGQERLLTENYYQEAPRGLQMEELSYFIEKQTDDKGQDFQPSYGQLIGYNERLVNRD